MYTFAFLLLCVQACLVQNVYSQCCRSPAPSCGQAYGGQGIGDVSVSGELPVCGSTQLCGQVPILGAVDFGGKVDACGSVNICGKCAECGCKGY